MSKSPIIDPALERFATAREWEVLSTVNRVGSKRGAAKELGCVPSYIYSCLERVSKKAARRGHAPEHPNFHVGDVPPGYILKGQSAFVDKNNKLDSRWDKTRLEGASDEEIIQLPDPKTVTKLSTMRDGEGRTVVQWSTERPDDKARETAWRKYAEKLAKDIRRVKSVAPPKAPAEHLMALYPIGDHHLGMLAWHEETDENWDIEIAQDILIQSVHHLVKTIQPCKQAVIAFMGDFLHYDNFEPLTPANKNLLDSDGRFPKMADAAIWTIRTAIDIALKQHEQVTIIVEIGNHDPSSSIMLALMLRHMYEKEPRIHIDTSPKHFHYYRFGKNLIGTHHGHGPKMQDLPLIMAADRKEEWGETDHHYWFVGHQHKDHVIDVQGVRVEQVRVLPPQDAWASQKGYRSARDMKAIVLHRDFGEVERHTVNPAMLVTP